MLILRVQQERFILRTGAIARSDRVHLRSDHLASSQEVDEDLGEKRCAMNLPTLADVRLVRLQ